MPNEHFAPRISLLDIDSDQPVSSSSSSSLLDDFLGETVVDNNPIVECPSDGDPRLKKSSYSSSLLQHGCLRKFQLAKLGTNRRDPDHLSQLTFDFGHAVGDAVVKLMCGEPRTKVIWELFLHWPNHLFAENPKQKKSLFHAIHAIDQFIAMREQGFMDDYEVVMRANGRPAAELSIKITFPHGYTERGYIDMVLRHKVTGKYAVWDNKTSSATFLMPENYKNSSQALGYSVSLERIDPGQTEYTVYYLVYMTKLERWEVLEFPKSMVQRAQWIQGKLWDIDELERVKAQEGTYGIWPIRGENCVSFGRVCEYMDMCHMQTENLIKPLRQFDLEDELVDRFGKPWDIELDIMELV